MVERERALSRSAIEAGIIVLRHLRTHPEGASREELAEAVEREGLNHSVPTMRRAIDWLRDFHDAPLDHDPRINRWILRDLSFTLPLHDPTGEDLESAMFAAALLGPLAPPVLQRRLEHLVEEMDALVRESGPGITARAPLIASVTSGTAVPHALVSTLIAAIGGHQVIHIEYYSPWRDELRGYDIEPWQLRVHDGSMYLRAHSRAAGEARSFRVTQIESARVLEGQEPRADRPDHDSIWGGDTTSVDSDRPGQATIRVKGAFARWLARERWHPQQLDTWVRKGELLERTMPYQSCRELARRLLGLGDALVSIEPAELREQVRAHVHALGTMLETPPTPDVEC
jgi:predicted DNA-binding transcriptional regulator YafY